jgi:hypothetical protein
MRGWWRRWRKTVARRKRQREKNQLRRSRYNDWDEITKYGDPFD